MSFESLFRLDGKVALITGSTRGIGLSTARLMAEAGAKVVISSRKAEACETVFQQFKDAGHEAISCPAHMGEAADRERLVQTTLDAFGKIDVLVVNAAVNPLLTPLGQVTETAWNKVIDVNLRAPWHLGQLVLPHIADQGGGAAILMSSVAGLRGSPLNGSYGVSKAALHQIARDFAAEWGPKYVRVNAVVPGPTLTDMVRVVFSKPEDFEKIKERTPLRRINEPEDVAALAVFLAAEGGRQITGQVITVDGGNTIYDQPL